MSPIGTFSQAERFQLRPPKEFSSLKEDFEEFADNINAYLNFINPTYGTMLAHLQECKNEVKEKDFKNGFDDQGEDREQMSRYLQWLLVSLCTDSASTFLQREETTTNGFETFRKLCQRYGLPAKNMSVGRLTTILNPNFDLYNFEDTLNLRRKHCQVRERNKILPQ